MLTQQELLLITTILFSFAVSSSFGTTIDNSNLIPPYKTDDKVKMEGTCPDWIKSLIIVIFN